MGVPVLAWPMDALADDGMSHVGCEIYPSFCRPARVPKSDDADARWTCLWASRADLAAALDLERAPAPVREAARLEGWILGAPPPRAYLSLPGSVPAGGTLSGSARQTK
jgi:hypothetical protein